MYSASISGGGGGLNNGSNGSPSSTNANNMPTAIRSNFTLTKKSNSFENSSNNTSTNKEFKSYLIDKLINENSSYPARQTHNNSNNNNKIEIAPSRSDFILSLNHVNQSKLDNNNNNSNSNTNIKNKHLTVPSLSKSDSKGDLASETGTYTVDDSPDIANPADLEEDLNVMKTKNNQENVIMRQSTNTNIELISARAAIDETFGIIKRPSIDIDDQSSTNNSLIIENNEISKRDKKSVRLRNVTYSLKDVINKQNDINTNNNTNNNQDSHKNTNNVLPQNSSFSESPSSSLSSISDNAANASKLKKTTTYNIISSSHDNDQLDQKSTIATARTVDTELLLGDTEKLMEQLKRNRQDKKEKLKSKFLVSKNNNETISTEKTHLQPTISQLLPSSTSSSSTNVSVDNNNNTNGKKLVSSWTIPSNEDNEPENYVVINTTRATVNSEEATTTSTPNPLTMMHLNKVGNGGLAFEFLIDEQKLNRTPPNIKSATILKTKKNSTNSEQNKTRDSLDDESLCSQSCCQSDRQSTSRTMDNHSITRNFLSRRHHLAKDDNQSNVSNVTSNSSTIGSPKSALSLGAKIQIKAKENSSNNNNNISNPNSPIKKQASNDDSHLSQYTNRALQLRQLSSKAKLDSHNPNLNKKQTSSSSSKSIGINRKSTVSAASSRANSRTSSPFGFHNQKINLMTTSLNLANGSMLPSNQNTNANDLFKRRKNYDPIKSLEMDKLKKQQNTSVLNTTNKSPRSNSVNLDNNSDESNSTSSQNKRRIKIDINNQSKTSIASNSNHKMSESMNSITSNNDSIFESSYNPNNSSFTVPIQQLANNIANKENYEAIMESTLQRLCIRLIQMSTAVLDKIG